MLSVKRDLPARVGCSVAGSFDGKQTRIAPAFRANVLGHRELNCRLRLRRGQR